MNLPPCFKQVSYVAKVHHLDLNKFIEEVCSRRYDSSEGLDFPSNGTMHEVNTSPPQYLMPDEEELRTARDWADGLGADQPDLPSLMFVLAERKMIPSGIYLIHVWW